MKPLRNGKKKINSFLYKKGYSLRIILFLYNNPYLNLISIESSVNCSTLDMNVCTNTDMALHTISFPDSAYPECPDTLIECRLNCIVVIFLPTKKAPRDEMHPLYWTKTVRSFFMRYSRMWVPF